MKAQLSGSGIMLDPTDFGLWPKGFLACGPRENKDTGSLPKLATMRAHTYAPTILSDQFYVVKRFIELADHVWACESQKALDT